MFRKIIFIGESQGKTIYFDTKEQIALEATKSRLLSTEKSRNNRLHIVMILALIPLIGPVGIRLLIQFFFSGGIYLTRGLILWLFLIWLFEGLGLALIVEKALYSNMQDLKPTNNVLFRSAIYSNLFWRNFTDKKVTLGKKLLALLFITIVPVLSLTPFFVFGREFFQGNFDQPSEVSSAIIPFALFGILFGVVYVILFQNNPYRFLKVAEAYQARKLKWKRNK